MTCDRSPIERYAVFRSTIEAFGVLKYNRGIQRPAAQQFPVKIHLTNGSISKSLENYIIMFEYNVF